MTHWIAPVAACWLAGCASTGNVHNRNDAAPVDAARAGCVTQSGSAIPQTGTACIGPGRSYSRTDIDHTGETTLAGALRILDPTVNINH
jgi:hypothetical protein